ncbi:hypothetical protein LCGC14_1866320, partial [marine sediment metagenome]
MKMSSNDLKEMIKDLENEAKIIQDLVINLINSAPIIFYDNLKQYGFSTLPENLIDIQQQALTKYNVWY